MNRHPLAAGIAALALAAITACAGPNSSDPTVSRPAPEPGAASSLAAAINATGFDIFHATRQDDTADLILSPVSIGTAFGMLDVGATGDVSAAIEELFGFPGEDAERWAGFNALTQGIEHEPDPARVEYDDDWRPQEPIVRIANRMFHDEGFAALPSYSETLARYWGAGIEALTLRSDPDTARDHINTWVNDRTNGLIPRLLPPGFIHADTIMVLVNAVYMLADWQTPFDAADTHEAPFTRLDGSEVTVDMMTHDDIRTRAVAYDDWAAIELPYAHSDLSMLVIVPAEGNYAHIEGGFRPSFVADVDASLEQANVALFLPTFTSEASLDLREIIAGDLGVNGLFGVEDLGGIGEGIAVDSTIHAAKIIVDERGTEAAAATAIGVELTSIPEPPELTIRADRPFLYLIRDESTGAILFMGRVLDPRP